MYLITSEYLKENVHVQSQINDEVLRVAFNEVQRMYIRPLLGENLLEALLVSVDAPTPLKGKRAQLLADVQYYFALRVHNTLLGFANIKTGNKGAVVPDNGADLEVLIYERGLLKEKYEVVRHDIELLIQQHPADFPEYYFSATGAQVEKPAARQGYGFFLAQKDRTKKIGG